MSLKLPTKVLDLLTEKKAFAHLATLMADGSLQVTPVWIDYDGTHILVNSAKGRLKDRNMEARPQVGVGISDPDDPYRYLSVRGRIVEIIEAGAEEHIDQMAQKYLGQEQYPNKSPDEQRRLYKIAIESYHTNR